MREFEIRFYSDVNNGILGVVLVDMFDGRAWSNMDDAEHREGTTRVNVNNDCELIEEKHLGDIGFGEQDALKELFNMKEI